MPGLKTGLPKFYLQEICIMKIASHGTPLQRQPLEPKRKKFLKRLIYYHTRFLKDSPWDKSRGSCTYVNVKLGQHHHLIIY